MSPAFRLEEFGGGREEEHDDLSLVEKVGSADGIRVFFWWQMSLGSPASRNVTEAYWHASL